MTAQSHNRQRYDAAAIIAANPIEEVMARMGGLALKPRGREYEAHCCFHSERTASLQIIPAEADQSGKGFFHCKGCGAHGDVIGFVQAIYGVGFSDACEILGGTKDGGCHVTPRDPKPVAPDPYADLEALPVPASPVVAGVTYSLWNAKRYFDPKPKPIWNARPSAVYAYRNAGGDLLGYVLRVDTPDGGKITPTIRYARCHDGRDRWAVWHFDPPRPLYRQETWASNPGPIWLVEGEKTADAAVQMLGAHASTWPGGVNGVPYADWSQLERRDVYLWPDQDQEGVNAMNGRSADDTHRAAPGVAEMVKAAGGRVLGIVDWDKSRPKGWDCADAKRDGWNRDDLMTWLRSNLRLTEAV